MLHVSAITSDWDTALGGLHRIGIEIGILGKIYQLTVILQTLFEQRNGSIQFLDILAPLIVEHMLSSLHLPTECVGKGTVTMHIVLKTTELILIAGYTTRNGIDGSHSLVAMSLGLSYDIKRQLTHMRLMLPLLLYIFDEFLALRTATLIETRIDGVLIWIHQLTHEHAQEQRLTVALSNTETAKELRRNLTALIVSLADTVSNSGIRSIVISKYLIPVITLGGYIATAIPGISAPCLVPHPVAVQLLLPLTAWQFICRIRPIPVTSLRIEMQGIGVMNIVHRRYRLLNERRR